MVSSPPPPRMVSSPLPPERISLSSPPAIVSLSPPPSTLIASPEAGAGALTNWSSPLPRKTATALNVLLSKAWATVPLPSPTSSVFGSADGDRSIVSSPFVPRIVRGLFATEADGDVTFAAYAGVVATTPAASAMAAARASRGALLMLMDSPHHKGPARCRLLGCRRGPKGPRSPQAARGEEGRDGA